MEDTTVSELSTITTNLIKICKLESNQKHTALPLCRPLDRAALYSGVSKKTLRLIKRKSDLDDTAKDTDNISRELIQSTISYIYRVKQIMPTSRSIIKELGGQFKGTTEDMRLLLKTYGYIWRRQPDKTYSVLTEKTNILTQRFNYLKAITEFKKKGSVYYVDEGRVDVKKNTFTAHWRPSYCKYKPDDSGRAFIQVVSNNGLLKHQYLQTLNEHTFKMTMDALLPLLRPNSMIVYSNAPHHGLEINPRPNERSLKKEIGAWLTAHDIPFHDSMARSELLALVMKSRKFEKIYKMDDRLKILGHKVLRVPDSIYHLTTTMCWADINAILSTYENVTAGNYEEKLKDKIQFYDWKKCYTDLSNMETEMLRKDIAMEELLDKLMYVLSQDDQLKTKFDFESDGVSSYEESDDD